MRSEGGSDDKELFRNTFPFFIWLLRDASNRVPPDCKDINQYFATRVRLRWDGFTIFPLFMFKSKLCLMLFFTYGDHIMVAKKNFYYV